jgi:hypothetical protein
MLKLTIAYLVVIAVSTVLLSWLFINLYRLLLKYREWYKEFLMVLGVVLAIAILELIVIAVVWAFFTVFKN